MSDEIKKVQIEIKRTGFPVTVGDFDLFFDSSMENLRKFLNLEEIIEAKTVELEEVMAELADTEEITDMAKQYDKAQMIMQAQMEVAWDTTFGAGTFKKLYAKYPDLWALNSAFDAAGEAIAIEIQKIGDERLEAVQGIKSDLLAKKAKKTTK